MKYRKEKEGVGVKESFIKKIYLNSLCLCLCLLSGCMLATQQDLLKIDDNMSRMRKQQADLVVKLTELDGNIQALNSQLESSQQRMSTLSQKLDDLQADLTRRLNVLTGQVSGTASPGASNPGDMLKLALNDFQGGKYELALVGFRNIVTQQPRSEAAPQAQFYLGESEFARKNYADAAREFDQTVRQYPKSDYAPKALYKKAIALQNLGKRADAAETLRALIKEYPRHELVKSAKDLLNP